MVLTHFLCEELSGHKMFGDYDKVKHEVMSWFKGLAIIFYYSNIQKLVPGVISVWKSAVNTGKYILIILSNDLQILSRLLKEKLEAVRVLEGL